MTTDKIRTIPTETLLLKYLLYCKQIGKTVEREDLKKDMQQLCGRLASKKIYMFIDFTPSGDTLYSKTLDADIWSCQSAGFIIQKSDQIVYEITDSGKKQIENTKSAFYENARQEDIIQLDKILIETK